MRLVTRSVRFFVGNTARGSLTSSTLPPTHTLTQMPKNLTLVVATQKRLGSLLVVILVSAWRCGGQAKTLSLTKKKKKRTFHVQKYYFWYTCLDQCACHKYRTAYHSKIPWDPYSLTGFLPTPKSIPRSPRKMNDGMWSRRHISTAHTTNSILHRGEFPLHQLQWKLFVFSDASFFFFFFYEWEHRTGTMCPFSSLHPLRKGKEV